jgi:hypothetical protein
MPQQRNEGEGNKTAARHYNEKTEKFAESGKVDEKAREAAQAVERDKAGDLKRAEQQGKSHAKGEDPKLKTGAKRQP